MFAVHSLSDVILKLKHILLENSIVHKLQGKPRFYPISSHETSLVEKVFFGYPCQLPVR
jgi:hypothetical protein